MVLLLLQQWRLSIKQTVTIFTKPTLTQSQDSKETLLSSVRRLFNKFLVLLDRINVRRLMIYVKKRIGEIADTILFDNNIEATWNRFLYKSKQSSWNKSNHKVVSLITKYNLILQQPHQIFKIEISSMLRSISSLPVLSSSSLWTLLSQDQVFNSNEY